jgi:RNA polymerase-binding transcription factor DksA
MSTEKLEEYKNKLNKEKLMIEEEIRQNSKPPDFGHDVDSFDEETDEAEAFNNQLALVQDFKKRLVDVESALNKIASGTYGICEKCGKEIEESVLDIDPESRFCKACKLENE